MALLGEHYLNKAIKMTKTNAPNLLDAVEWLMVKNGVNRYSLEYMAEAATSSDKEAEYLLEILNAVVSGELVQPEEPDLAVTESPSDDHQSGLVSVDEPQPVAWQTQNSRGEWAGTIFHGNYRPFGVPSRPLYAHPAPERCYEVRDGYEIGAAKVSGDGCLDRISNLSEALTIRSVEDVRREAFDEAAIRLDDSMTIDGARAVIRQLAEK